MKSFTEQKLIELKGNIHESAIKDRDFNISLLVMERIPKSINNTKVCSIVVVLLL